MKKELILVWLVIGCGMALAEPLPLKDVSISIILPSNINVSAEYNRLFRLVNHNSVTGVNDGLLVSVEYNITKNNTLIDSESVNRSLNSYTETGMGTLILNKTGNYTICANIKALNYEDPNPANDKACLDFIAIGEFEEETIGNSTGNETITEPFNETIEENVTEKPFDFCTCQTTIITDKIIYEKGERIDISFETCKPFSSYPYALEYWVEDLFGGIVKAKLNTTNPAPKRFTPRLDEPEKTFIVKGWFPECNNTASPALVVFRDRNVEEKIPFLALIVPEKAVPGEVFFVDITGFKGNSRKTVLSLWVELEGKKVSGITKTYITGSNIEFSQRIPLIIGSGAKSTGNYSLVAEGLDLEAEEQLYVEVKEENIPEKKTGIRSFYTRKINFDENINVFITTENAEGLLLRIVSSKETIESYVPRSNSLSKSINISSPTEILVAELLGEDGILISTENLHLNLSYTKEVEKEPSILVEEKKEIITSDEEIPEKKTKEPEPEPEKEKDVLEEAYKSSFSNYWLLLLGSTIIIIALFGKDAYKYINSGLKSNSFKKR